MGNILDSTNIISGQNIDHCYQSTFQCFCVTRCWFPDHESPLCNCTRGISVSEYVIYHAGDGRICAGHTHFTWWNSSEYMCKFGTMIFIHQVTFSPDYNRFENTNVNYDRLIKMYTWWKVFHLFVIGDKMYLNLTKIAKILGPWDWLSGLCIIRYL